MMILIYADGKVYLLDPRDLYDPFPDDGERMPLDNMPVGSLIQR